nr:unnamed protein product [Callosobruchus chinensis]
MQSRELKFDLSVTRP